MKHIIMQVVAACLLVFSAAPAAAKSAVVSIPMTEVGSHAGERGTFYVLDLTVPEEVAANHLDSVVLEFAVDATVSSEEDSVATPFVGVYPVTSDFVASRGEGAEGTVEAPEFEAIVPSSRPVAAGEHRVLRMEITGIVREWIASPTTNHGLVIGTLTGPEVGTITLNDALPGGSAAVKVTFLYSQ
jgi:hypothetical protein